MTVSFFVVVRIMTKIVISSLKLLMMRLVTMDDDGHYLVVKTIDKVTRALETSFLVVSSK